MKYRIHTIKFRKFISSNQKSKSCQNTHLKLKIMQSRKTNLSELYPRIEISVFTDISVLRFYGYIGNIGEISVDIFSQISIE